ncbi:homoserine O-acetyltransferase [Thalassobacillus sp. CUG 92003]|uniref:homoserine O-acetyltransferase MetX n=1 Tax=Thalassobacillus sp. CUG 92003 TaxID=2736641 RepID=UPI0015E78686|nr:homoserine O-acetyltransferase [Thalassobacillus sp. CUG 92003]
MSLKSPVTKQHTTEHVNIGSFRLDSGIILPEVSLAYERVGPADAPAIVICHALTGNQFAKGSDEAPGWWHGLIGDGNVFDTQQFQTITFNVIGGCHGSTGPASRHPVSQHYYQTDFPVVTVRDMVRAQYEALKILGINEAKAVIGASLGGMQTLEWGLLYPTFMEQLFVIAATPSLSDYGIAFNHIGAKAIKTDPAWNDGRYNSNQDLSGFEIARMAGMVTYRSAPLFDQRFGRTLTNERHYQIQTYLDHQGEKIKERFDANSYLYLLEAMNHHDIGEGRGGIEKASQLFKAPVYTLSFQHDLLYPKEQMENFAQLVPEGDHFHVETDFGHDGFLVEFERWNWWVEQKLNQ